MRHVSAAQVESTASSCDSPPPRTCALESVSTTASTVSADMLDIPLSGRIHARSLSFRRPMTMRLGMTPAGPCRGLNRTERSRCLPRKASTLLRGHSKLCAISPAIFHPFAPGTAGTGVSSRSRTAARLWRIEIVTPSASESAQIRDQSAVAPRARSRGYAGGRRARQSGAPAQACGRGFRR